MPLKNWKKQTYQLNRLKNPSCWEAGKLAHAWSERNLNLKHPDLKSYAQSALDDAASLFVDAIIYISNLYYPTEKKGL